MSMATAVEKIKTRRGLWMVDVSLKSILGQGAYGIVYRAWNSKRQYVATKRINTLNGKKIPKISGLEKLIGLDHPNIVKVFDIHQTEKEIWIFMDLCEGDLNTFFYDQVVSYEKIINIMKQITAGIDYLHANGVIHRDIKPQNILLYSKSPILIKLTDFDVSKFIEEYATATMSTNVGTLAFKAPEFFQRTKEGKLKYHRSVDTFAVGLSFLAMLQGKESKKLTIPRIETPRIDSERYAPSIGQLIAERRKYDIKELSVVKIDNIDQSSATEDRVRMEMKLLIQKMTTANFKDRIKPSEVLLALQTIEGFLLQSKI